jgi:hypothetical protein
MKIQEIISEAISGAHWIHGLHNGLNDILEQPLGLTFNLETINGFNAIAVYLKDMSDGRICSFYEKMQPGDIHYTLEEIVTTAHYVIQQKYAKVCADVSGTNFSHIQILPQSNNPGALASAGYDYVTFYETDKNAFQHRDIDMLKDLLYSTEAMTDVNRGWSNAEQKNLYVPVITDMFQIEPAFRNLKLGDFSLAEFFLDTKNIDNMVHELVHIRQHAPQSRYKTKRVFDKDTKQHKLVTKQGTEFRSKVEPNQEKFYNAIRDLDKSPENYKIYSSSLQEIPAHAHDAAVSVIRHLDFAWGGSVDEYGRDVSHLKSQVKALKLIIANLSNGPTALKDVYGHPIKIRRFEYFSKTFNHPNDKKLYPVYKKFVKIMSQELINYYNYWNEKLINLSKSNGQ